VGGKRKREEERKGILLSVTMWQAASSEKTIDKVAMVLFRKLSELEMKLKDIQDERVSEWEEGQEFEKIELRERIQLLEERQVKILARYEQMRHTLSRVSEQVFNMKQKLRYHKSEAIANMAKVLSYDTAPIPLDTEQMREMVIALKIDNKKLTGKLPVEEAKEEGGGGGEKEGQRRGKKDGKGGGGAAATSAEAVLPVAAGQSLLRDGEQSQRRHLLLPRLPLCVPLLPLRQRPAPEHHPALHLLYGQEPAASCLQRHEDVGQLQLSRLPR
jgi:hypothetical protein